MQSVAHRSRTPWRLFTFASACPIALASMVSVSVGCAHQDPADRSIEKMKAEISKIQADRDRLDERLGALEAADQRRFDSEPKAQTTTLRAEPPTAEHGHLPVVRVGDNGVAESPAPDEGEAADLGTGSGDDRPVVQETGSRGGRADQHPRGRDRVDSSTLSPEAKRDYEAALSLVRAKQYAKALELLTRFLVKYPDHAYADNAMYWRGECFYAQADYGRAAEQFEGVIARFPFGNKAPDALLKLGLTQQRLGSQEQAQRTFADLKDRYPKSDAVRQVPRQ